MIYLGAGSNEGDRWEALSKAYQALLASGVRIVRASPVYETIPWGVTEQPPYLNVVWEVETHLSPQELLRVCQMVENLLGRPRQNRIRWGPRIIDLDLLAYGDIVCETPELTLPHPWIPHRPFVLGPWKDLAPYFYLVPWDATVWQLWQRWAGSFWGVPVTPPVPLQAHLPPTVSPQIVSDSPAPSRKASPSLKSAIPPPP